MRCTVRETTAEESSPISKKTVKPLPCARVLDYRNVYVSSQLLLYEE